MEATKGDPRIARVENLPQSWTLRSRQWRQLLRLSFLAAVLGSTLVFIGKNLRQRLSGSLTFDQQCPPPILNLFSGHPPDPHDPQFISASNNLHIQVEKLLASGSVDSISIAVVTSAGAVFEGNYGVLKANETDPLKRGSVNDQTIYRLASVSKLFTALETAVLNERGVLNWDDSLTSFFPDFEYKDIGWNSNAVNQSSSLRSRGAHPITLRQLASHMAGFPRDLPRNNFSQWPHSLQGGGPPSSVDEYPWPSADEIFDYLASTPLVSSSYNYPIYSNVGFAVLGLANAAADKLHRGGDVDSTLTHAELLQRDIFGPLQMFHSSFISNETSAPNIAVASIASEAADANVTNPMNPIGGQFSSRSDLVKVMQTFLNPEKEGTILSPYSFREWLRPMHIWGDGYTRVGMPWEILSIKNSFGRTQNLYQKYGDFAGYHAAFTITETGYGIVVLTTGKASKTYQLVNQALGAFQPAFDKLLATATQSAYGGRWVSSDAQSVARIGVQAGLLILEAYFLNGTDVLELWRPKLRPLDREPGSVQLWSTGRTGEFRISFTAGRSDWPGCMAYWTGLDVGDAQGSPIDLLYFRTDATTEDLILEVPSSRVTMRKVQT